MVNYFFVEPFFAEAFFLAAERDFDFFAALGTYALRADLERDRLLDFFFIPFGTVAFLALERDLLRLFDLRLGALGTFALRADLDRDLLFLAAFGTDALRALRDLERDLLLRLGAFGTLAFLADFDRELLLDFFAAFGTDAFLALLRLLDLLRLFDFLL